MAELKELMFEGLKLEGAPRLEEVEEISKSMTETRERFLESLRKVIGI